MKSISKNKLYILIFAAAIVCSLIFAFFTANLGVAYADSTYDTVFPSETGYIQSESPTLIAANADYLLVYDAAQGKLYARSSTLGTLAYDAQADDVQSLFAVGDKAFFVTASGNFSLDLTAQNPTLEPVVLATPDDITYFTTDGTYLYAKSAFGYVTIYNDDFQVALGKDNVRNVALTGNSVLIGSADVLGIFTATYGFPHYTILNLATDETEEHNITSSVQAATFGDDAIIFALVGGVITIIDKPTGDAILTTEIAPDAFSSYGRNLFTIENGQVNVYTLSQNLEAIELTASLRMTGNDLKHLNAPVSIEKMNGKFAIADKNNNRIAYYQNGDALSSTYDFDASPLALAHDGNVLYIACAEQILKLNGMYVEQRYDFAGAKDILFLDKLYALKDDGVYCLISGELDKLYEVTNPIAFAAAEKGTNVFVLTETEVIVIDKNGNKLPTSLTGNFAGAKALAVDFGGNPIVAYENKIEVYTNQIASLSLKNTTNLEGSLRVTLNSCTLDGKTLYFTTNESFIGKVTLDVETQDDYATVTVPTKVDAQNYSFKQPANADTAYVMPLSKRIESISLASEAVVMTSENALAPDGYLLAYDGEKLFYVPAAQFSAVNLDTLSGEYVATKETTLFVLPNVQSDDNVVLNEGDHVVFTSSTAGFDGGVWVLVTHQNKTYFAKQSDFAEYVAPVPERKTQYGRAKGSRVGGVVNVYQSADENSVVILEVADGQKLEILEEQGDFYQVKIGETIGYMRKSDVELGALTSVQIVSIVLAIAVLLAGSTIFFAIYMTKKKQSNE